MKFQISGMDQAVENIKQGIGMVTVMDGALQEYHNILQRMNELAHQSSNGTLDDKVDRPALQKEFESLREELSNIANCTKYNETLCFRPGTPVETPPPPPPPVYQKPTLDVVFVLDRTGSMGGPITNVKENLNHFVSELSSADVRIGIAHYTDGQTPPVQLSSFSGENFTNDMEAVKQELERVLELMK